MKKCLLFGHGGCYGHGNEAIFLSSIETFTSKFDKVYLSTNFKKQDLEFGLDKYVDEIIEANWDLISEERSKLTFEEKEIVDFEIYKEALNKIDKSTIVVGLIGDSYCYGNHHRFSVFLKKSKEVGVPCFLWGCSIEPSIIDESMATILKQHDHIYVRETFTLKAMEELGFENISYRPDPAFILKAKETWLPEGFKQGQTVALNVAPLSVRYNENLIDCFVKVAKNLIAEGITILLLSHVSVKVDNDEDALGLVYEKLGKEEKKNVIRTQKNLNAEESKYIISKCEMVVCCRTHVSIAAYSSCVPTLVVSHSVKSRGIGFDLGMSDWVVPVSDTFGLHNKAMDLWKERIEIRSKLCKKMLDMKKRCNENPDFIC